MRMTRHILLANKLLVALSGTSRFTRRPEGYVYEQHAYHIDDRYLTFRWNKSAIRQFLVYASLCDGDGMLSFASERDVAGMIHCSVRTVQNNNRRFEEAGILTTRRIWGEFVDITIHDFLDVVRDIDLGGNDVRSRTGYTSVWHELMTEILAIPHVNDLRFALRCLVLHEKEIHVRGEQEAVLTYDEIRGFLPVHLGFREAIRRTTERLSQIFDLSCFEDAALVSFMKEGRLRHRRDIKERLNRPFVVALGALRLHDSRLIRTQERREAYAEWFAFLGKVRQHVDLPLDVLRQDDVFSLADRFGVEPMRQLFNRLVNRLSDERLAKSLTDQLRDRAGAYLHDQLHALV